MARNGRLSEDGIRLVTVEDNDQLIATAAASFFAMRAAAAAEGVTLSIVEPAGAYRSAWVQNDMVDNPGRYNLNPKSIIKFGRSGQSHGWGNRIDVNSAAVPWMLRNATRFGWSREYGARDPNHFKHDGVTATGGGSSGAGVTPDPVNVDEGEPMTDFIYYCTSASTDKKIALKAMFYQECIGAPLYPFTNYQAYDSGAFGSEYSAFKGRYGKISDEAVRIEILGDDMQKLIALRGVTSKPIGNFETVATGGTITVNSDPAVVELLQELIAKVPTKATFS
jgi:hypothetical protein